jgi:hypothetical protein
MSYADGQCLLRSLEAPLNLLFSYWRRRNLGSNEDNLLLLMETSTWSHMDDSLRGYSAVMLLKHFQEACHICDRGHYR